MAEAPTLDWAVELDFTGRSMPFGIDDLAPVGLPTATDGFGNFWLVDLADGDVMAVWREHADAIDRQTALGGDQLLREFVQESPDHDRFVDLRDAPLGAGFPWARDRVEVTFRRHPSAPVFAFTEQRRGFLRRKR